MVRRIGFAAWLLLLLLGLFPVAAAGADLAADLRGQLPTDHQGAFDAIVRQPWADARQIAPGLADYVTLLETGYALHELVFGVLFLTIVAVPLRRGAMWAWWVSWVVLVADLGYTFTFGRHDETLLSRSLVADVALPVLLLAQLPRLRSSARGSGESPGAADGWAGELRRVIEGRK